MANRVKVFSNEYEEYRKWFEYNNKDPRRTEYMGVDVSDLYNYCYDEFLEYFYNKIIKDGYDIVHYRNPIVGVKL